MATLLSFLTLLGFELLYYSSQKAQFARNPWLEAWVAKLGKYVKWAAIALLLVSLVGFQWFFGFGSGSFYFLAALMLAGGLAFLLSPVRHFDLQWVALAFLILFTLELI
jgi:hypothetical protein